MSDGNVNEGAVVSGTVTRNVEVPTLPAVSAAEQVTEVEPRAKVDPDGGLHMTVGDSGPTRSEAVGFVKVTAAPEGPVASAVTGA